jgi:hypothetical protein
MSSKIPEVSQSCFFAKRSTGLPSKPADSTDQQVNGNAGYKRSSPLLLTRHLEFHVSIFQICHQLKHLLQPNNCSETSSETSAETEVTKTDKKWKVEPQDLIR